MQCDRKEISYLLFRQTEHFVLSVWIISFSFVCVCQAHRMFSHVAREKFNFLPMQLVILMDVARVANAQPLWAYTLHVPPPKNVARSPTTTLNRENIYRMDMKSGVWCCAVQRNEMISNANGFLALSFRPHYEWWKIQSEIYIQYK